MSQEKKKRDEDDLMPEPADNKTDPDNRSKKLEVDIEKMSNKERRELEKEYMYQMITTNYDVDKEAH